MLNRSQKRHKKRGMLNETINREDGKNMPIELMFLSFHMLALHRTIPRPLLLGQVFVIGIFLIECHLYKYQLFLVVHRIDRLLTRLNQEPHRITDSLAW